MKSESQLKEELSRSEDLMSHSRDFSDFYHGVWYALAWATSLRDDLPAPTTYPHLDG